VQQRPLLFARVSHLGLPPDALPAAAYPFSSSAIVRQVGLIAPDGITPAPTVKSPLRGTMARLTAELRTQYDSTGRISQMFSRRSAARIPPGSVLIVETWTSAARTGFSTFSGVLVAVRRRGVASAFVLRTLVQKLGVEVRFAMYSPLLKDIKVLSRADAGKDDKTGRLRRTRRAKLYYLRHDDRKIAGISRVVAQMRQREERERQEAANKRGGRK
jgi:large subunit ribosomal protein L19